MSDDDEDKTEEPTDRKLRKAREEGNVPKSEDFNGFVGLMMGVVIIFIFSILYPDKLRKDMGECLESIFIHGDGSYLTKKCNDYLTLMSEMGGLILASGVLAVFLGYIIMNKGFVIPKQPLKFNVDALNIGENLKNIINKQNAIGLLTTFIKESFFYGSFFFITLYFFPAIVYQTFCFENCKGQVPLIFIYVLVATYTFISLIFTAIDVPLKIMFWKNKLKMSHKDIKDEHKETEGAPEIKRAQHEFRNQLFHGAPLGAKNATFFVKGNNIIFGIRYNRNESPAPIIVVAGKTVEKAIEIGQIAQQMRRLIIQDDSFAQNLANLGVIGRPVPLEFVTDVRRCIMKLKKHEQEFGSVHPPK
jgi:flagellar biosynthesis protein FlhB